MKAIESQTGHRDPQRGQAREIQELLAPLRHRLRRRRRARPSRARGDRQQLRRQCRIEGARGGRSERPPRPGRRQRPVGRCACTASPASSPRAGPRTRHGNRDFGRAMERVWREVEAAGEDAGHDAHFVCALSLAWPDNGQAESFEGRVDGTLIWPPRGDNGFGYDPMFVPVGHDQTLRRIRSGGKARHQPPGRGVQAD